MGFVADRSGVAFFVRKKTASRFVQPFWCRFRVWQTYGRTYSAYCVNCITGKTVCICIRLWASKSLQFF